MAAMSERLTRRARGPPSAGRVVRPGNERPPPWRRRWSRRLPSGGSSRTAASFFRPKRRGVGRKRGRRASRSARIHRTLGGLRLTLGRGLIRSWSALAAASRAAQGPGDPKSAVPSVTLGVDRHGARSERTRDDHRRPARPDRCARWPEPLAAGAPALRAPRRHSARWKGRRVSSWRHAQPQLVEQGLVEVLIALDLLAAPVLQELQHHGLGPLAGHLDLVEGLHGREARRVTPAAGPPDLGLRFPPAPVPRKPGAQELLDAIICRQARAASPPLFLPSTLARSQACSRFSQVRMP